MKEEREEEMMSKIGTALLALIITAGASGAAMAKGTKSPYINRVQHNQQQRIGEGVESGNLTPGEAARLERREQFIRHEEKLFKSDGNFTSAERADIRGDLRRESGRIYRLKHN